MKKVIYTISAAAFLLSAASCSKETTCECQSSIITEDGSRVQDGEPTTRVVESKDADCAQYNDYQDNLVGNDREIQCEEKVFD